MHPTRPRSLASAEGRARRLELLTTENQTQPLREFAADLEQRRGTVPLFDPTDAGVEAKVLILLEAPGPMTNANNERPGSGFISADNDDRTAENLWRARDQAGLHSGVLLWNAVPWYLGPASKKPTAVELGQGAMELRRLLALLPDLRVALLSGRYAQEAWTKHVAPFVTLPTINTWHPSPLSLNSNERREDLDRALSRAASYLY